MTLTIIARKVPWPSLTERPDRAGLRLRWDAVTEDGDVLYKATEFPFLDGAYALACRGVDPETLVTMRHEGAAHDSFRPMPLRVVAAMGQKRAEKSAKLDTLHERTATTGADATEDAADDPGRPLAERLP